MLSGYAPSAAAVEAVGAIGLDLQQKAQKAPGSFFWGESYCFGCSNAGLTGQCWILSWVTRAGCMSMMM